MIGILCAIFALVAFFGASIMIVKMIEKVYGWGQSYT